MTQKTYSNSDPTVAYCYDSTAGGNFGIGRRTAMTDASGSTSWVYDQMGRVSTENDVIGGITKTISTAYNLDSSVNTVSYPTGSGSVVAYGYNSAGHVTSVTDTVHGLTYAQNTFYAPPGELAQATLGNAVQTNVYNSRLQPCWIYVTSVTPLPLTTACTDSAAAGTLLDVKYNFGFGANDNGNIYGITNNANTSFSKTFTYDALNRIQGYMTPNSTLWNVQYTIDAWGNMTNKTPQPGYGGESLAAPANGNNQLTGFSYDGVGNMTNDGRFTYTFNAENQVVTASSGVSFVYDGDGERVQKSDGTTYWGGGSSGALMESDNSGNPKAEYIFFNGKRIARRDLPSGNIRYYFADNLGSASVIADTSGNLLEQYDYAPYGELHWSSGSDSNHYLFTGKERDTETGLDYFGARYYGNNLGRWLSPDWAAKPTTVPYASFGDPQTLNLYGYVRNNPAGSVDDDGHCAVPMDGNSSSTACNDSLPPTVNDGGVGVADNSVHTPGAQQTGSYVNTARIAADVKGVGKILLGVGLVGTIAFGDLPGGALGAGLILSGTLGGLTTSASGVADIAGNHTNTDVREANEVLEHTSTVSGLVFSATGHPKAAGVAGTLESAATLGFRPKDAMKNPATMIDAGRTVQGLIDLGRKAWGAVSSAFSSGSIDTLP